MISANTDNAVRIHPGTDEMCCLMLLNWYNLNKLRSFSNDQKQAFAMKWKCEALWRLQYKFSIRFVQLAAYGVITHLAELNAQFSCTFTGFEHVQHHTQSANTIQNPK